MTGAEIAVGPWTLAPEGALIHERERLAVVADIHLGYEWARGRGGDCIPAHSLAETLNALRSLRDRAPIDRLVVAGDLVESRTYCRRTEADLGALTRWLLDRGITLIPIAGNHDPPRRPRIASSLEVDGWTIAHGHRPIDAARTISGHEHPVLRTGPVTARCFLAGPETIVLPAFSANAAGRNVAVASEQLPDAWRGRSLRCVAAVGTHCLDFGPLEGLNRRLLAAGSRS